MSFNSQTYAEKARGSATTNESRYSAMSEKDRIARSQQAARHAARIAAVEAIAANYKAQKMLNKQDAVQPSNARSELTMPEQLAQPEQSEAVLQDISLTEPEQAIDR
ncbi:MAG TPA: hypothetical protein VMR95_01005 [Candidatus Binatia bacterium]|jgi:hypothetical protein|nr:hypothetical protein [Candidatus Binatia bacterium]